jgi:hypothetical protein
MTPDAIITDMPERGLIDIRFVGLGDSAAHIELTPVEYDLLKQAMAARDGD